MPPSTITRQPGVGAGRQQRPLHGAPSAAELTRRSISQPASGEITFGRDPPQIGAAFSVMPRSMSTIACSR